MRTLRKILTTRSRISYDEVNAVCGKLARRIVVLKEANVEAGSKFYPEYAPRPSAAEREHFLNSKNIRAGFYEVMYQECKGFAEITHSYGPGTKSDR